MPEKKRKWNDDYVKYGFTCVTEKDGTQRPQCVLCNSMFSNESLRPSKLDAYFQSKHYGVGSVQELNAKRARFDKSGALPALGFVSADKQILLASYKVAHRIAKAQKPYTIGEVLIKPCTLAMVRTILGKEAEKKMMQVSPSNDVIRSRICDIGDHFLCETVSEIRASQTKISIQLDETTDVSNCSQLLVFARYVYQKEVKEKFLFCQPLELTTKAVDILKAVKDFFST